jgi:hypothetical protein
MSEGAKVVKYNNMESQIAISDTLHVTNDRQMRASW